MSRKKGAAVAIIAVVAVIGGLAAYANMPKAEDSNPPPVLSTINRSGGPDDDGATTVAEDSEEQQPANTSGATANNTSVSNNTVIESNTIVINKPVYRNDMIIYQPVTISLEKYKTTINQYGEREDDPDQPADTSHSITINAKRIKSEGWSPRFTDDKVGMFAAVYDINGGLVKAGYADERGFEVRGLEDRLYFVFPADCADCGGGKNDIMFRQWEDGSSDRPRLVPADSEVTASYRLVVPEKPKQVPLTPPPSEAPPETPQNPPDETETAAEPEVTLRAQDATYVYGWVQLTAQVENKVEGYDDIVITVYAPNGSMRDSFSYSDQQGFFASREAGAGDYRIVASYEYGEGTEEAEITHPIEFATPEFANLSVGEDDGAVVLNGMLRGGLAGENITIAISGPDGDQLRQYAMSFGTRPVFTLFIPAEDAEAIFNGTGNYTFAVKHDPTGVTGNATLSHDAGETGTAAAPANVSDNPGRSSQAAVAAQGSKVYLVWADDASGRHEILFAKSDDSGETFSEPVVTSPLEEDGFAMNPDIAVDGDNIYVVWADYDSDEASTAAFIMSGDAGETFGNKTTLGNYTGEFADPRVALLGGDIYVSWVVGAAEEFTGDLMLARSSNGADFEAAPVAEEVDLVSMVSSGDRLHLAWLHYPTGDASEDHVNMLAETDDGVNLETSEVLEEITVTSLAASGGDLYAAGYSNGTVVFAKGSNGTFDTTDISAGNLAYLAAAGDRVYLAWEQDDDVFLAASSDRGETFGEAENVSDSGGAAFQPAIAIADDAYVAWTEGSGDDTDIMFAVR